VHVVPPWSRRPRLGNGVWGVRFQLEYYYSGPGVLTWPYVPVQSREDEDFCVK
jgi:hypothetical protein